MQPINHIRSPLENVNKHPQISDHLSATNPKKCNPCSHPGKPPGNGDWPLPRSPAAHPPGLEPPCELPASTPSQVVLRLAALGPSAQLERQLTELHGRVLYPGRQRLGVPEQLGWHHTELCLSVPRTLSALQPLMVLQAFFLD